MKSKFTQCISILMLSILLTSCIVSQYKRPQIIDNNLYRDAGPKDSANISIANYSWREYFLDPKLQILISEGLTNNYDLQIADTRIRQAEAALSTAKLSFLPTLSVGPSVNYNKTSAAQGISQDRTIFQLNASTSWEADIWGKISSAKKAALASYMQSEAYKRVVKTSLISNIANTYYNLLALDKQLQITLTTIKLLQESVKTMQDLKDANIVTGAAVEQSKALLYSTMVTVPDIEQNIRELENSICFFIGRDPGPVDRSTLDIQTTPAQLSYGVPAQLLSKRPDVLQAEYAYRAAFENTNIAKASLYPSLTLTGSAGYSTRNSLNNFFDYSSLFTNIIGGLTQPIFNQGRLKSQLKISQAQQAEALLNFKSTVLNAGNEVSNALSAYDLAKRKDHNRNLQIESLEKSVDFTRQLLIYSNANYTEVLTAEQNLLNARLGQVNDKLQQLQSAINLYKALGGGTN